MSRSATDEPEVGRNASWYGPAVLAGVFLLVLGALLWLVRAEQSRVRQHDLEETAVAARESFRLRLRGNEDFLLLLADARGRGDLGDVAFQERAGAYVVAHPELINVTWVDDGGVIRDVAPRAANRQILGLALSLPEPRRAAAEARERQRPVYTRAFEAIQGQPSFEVWVSVRRGQEHGGHLAGVYSCSRLLQTVASSGLERRHHVQLIDGAGALLAELPRAGPVEPGRRRDVSLSPPGQGLTLRLQAYGPGPGRGGLLLLGALAGALAIGMGYSLWALRQDVARRRLAEAQRDRLLADERTARAVAEAAHLQLTQTLERIDDGFGAFDRDLRYTFVNEKLAASVGRRREDLLGRQIWTVFPEAVGTPVYHAYARAMSEQRPIDLEHLYPPLGRWFRHRFYPSPEGLTVFSRDVTEIHRAEEALRENAERLAALGDNLPDAYVYQYTLGPDGRPRFLYVSAGVERVHGLTVEEILRDAGVVHGQIEPEQRRALPASEIQSSQSLADFHSELRICRADGQWRWVRLRSRPRRVADGTVVWDGVATDVTDQKEAGATIRRERDFSQAVLDSLPGVLYCYDESLRFLRWNRNFESVTGYGGTEVANLSPLDLFAAEDRALVSERIHEVFEKGASDVEADFLAKDGTRTPYYFTGVATHIDGRPHLVGVGIDVSRRRAAEAAQRESEARLGFALRTSRTGGWELDLVDHTAHRTLEHDRIFGYESLLPLWTYEVFLEHVVPEDREEVDRRFREATGKGTDWNFECRIRRADGEQRWIWAAGGHERDQEGRARRMAGIVQDITERKGYELRLQGLVAVIQKLAMAQDAEAVMEAVRSAARHLTGADGATLVLRDGEQCHYVDEDAIAPLWKGRRFPLRACISGWAMLNRQTVVVEDIYADPRIPVEAYRPTFVKSLAMVPVRTDDPLGAIGCYWARSYRATAEDLQILGSLADAAAIALQNVRAVGELERRVAERTADLAEARDRAEAADRTKSAFLATMSHELRTPLNSVIGFTGLLLRGLAGALNPEQARQLNMVRNSGQHLLALINDVLDISKIEAGQVEIERGPFLAAEAIGRAVDSVRPQVEKKGLGFEVRLSPELGTLVADRRRFEQVLLNLLSNAIKFTERGGVSLEAKAHPGGLRVSVADTGPGIAPEDLGRLFQPFRQLDSGLTRQHEGTGLGLAICKRLVEMMGGTISVESERGRGSTFSFTLPREAPDKS